MTVSRVTGFAPVELGPSPATRALNPPIGTLLLPTAVKGARMFGRGGPRSPGGQEMLWSHWGREYLRAERWNSSGLRTEKHLASHQSKHPLLSPRLSLAPILLIDRRQENTQAHKSSLLRTWNSNRHENAQAPCEEDMRDVAQDEGKSFMQREQRQQPESKVASQGRVDGFCPRPSAQHTHVCCLSASW